jgi:hypothetical protein
MLHSYSIWSPKSPDFGSFLLTNVRRRWTPCYFGTS